MLDKIKASIRKQATIFHTGGKRPTSGLLESWIGSVRWRLDGEELPIDESGDAMTPLATLFIEGLPYVPEALQGIALLTVCISTKVFDNLTADDLSPWFAIRKYTTLNGLIPCQWNAVEIRPFPLTPELVTNDFPVWDGGGLPPHTETEIVRLEADGVLDYHDDIYEENYAIHKIGGYPSFCQSGFWFAADYPYILQLTSDEKACLNIVDCGNFYFFYNPALNDWKVYCDFY